MSAIKHVPRSRLGRQALPVRARAGMNWTPEEEEYLSERYALVSDEWLARMLGRTQVAIRERALRLGITRRTAFFNACQAGAIMGVNSKTIAAWIGEGCLTGSKSAVVGAGKHKVWCIFQEDLAEFIKKHPDIYDYRRIHPEEYRYWRNLAKTVAVRGRAPRLVQVWRPEEDAIILNHHGRLTNRQLGEKLHRTKEAVHQRIQVLRALGHILPYKKPWRGRWKAGPRIVPEQRQKWSAEEDEYLRVNWGRRRETSEPGTGKQNRRYTYITAGELAKAMGRTKMAVWTRAYRLGLAKGRGFRSDLVPDASDGTTTEAA